MDKRPLFDAQAPIVCTLSATEMDQRIALIDGLRTRLTQLERSNADLVPRWDAPPAARPILARFEAFFSGREPAEVVARAEDALLGPF